MQNDSTADTQPSVSKLMSAIVNDVQNLVQQQLTMFRIEMKEDLQTARSAGIQIVAALGVGFVGVCQMAFMCAYGIATAYPTIPLWACFGIVGIPIVAGSAIMLYVALRKLRSVRPLSDESARAMKENLQWLTSSR